ncbi:phage terminase large subunit [Sphingomonas psychrolutea]|uniref:Phage terminase large subunit n=1 Tax=Sphingomonas psychrolutea TaxID=1259676 RepID=A0ABQ1H8S7_9SPHN|nr:phage terminase large subunit [Sphingomonas psychrolutea]GGA62239.1 phage terminase large subunit [Sphingomonas psychrolutea]
MTDRHQDEQVVEATPYQQRVLSVPESIDLFLGGGRGGGKSHCKALLILRHIEQYRDRARVLYVRKTYKGLSDFELVLRQLFGAAYGSAASYNASEHVFRLPYGYVELAQVDSFAAYDKVQGRSFTMILVDEVTQWATPQVIDMLRSNLRGPKDIPLRTVYAGNPGGVGHQWVAARYVLTGKAWAPFPTASGRPCVHAPSTFLDNPHLDGDDYRLQLRAACAGDDELFRAWTEGDWSVARGAFFAGCLSPERCAIDPWKSVPYGWRTHLAHDFGSSSPSATYLLAISPGATGPDACFYPRGSIVALDELATTRPNRPSEGLGWTVPRLAEAIRDMCGRWSVKPSGAADDAIFARARGHSAATIADEFSRSGVTFYPAGKGSRKAGWQRMRTLLSQAGKPDLPGLYLSRSCDYAWETLPVLPRDPRDIEDVDSAAPDHAADAIRYGIGWRQPRAQQGVW